MVNANTSLRGIAGHGVNLLRLPIAVFLLLAFLVVSASGEPPSPKKASPKATPLPTLLETRNNKAAARVLRMPSPGHMGALSAPTNDDFDSATAVGALPFLDVVDITDASAASDDPDMGCGAGTNSNTVWYRFTPSVSGEVIAHTLGSDYDTVLAVFTGTRGSLNLVTCNDDAPDTLQSKATFNARGGQTYYIEIADFGSPDGGTLVFSVQFPNDDFDDATPVTRAPFQSIVDTTSTTVADDDPDMGCGAGVNSNTVWYRFTSPVSDEIVAYTFGSNYDTVLAIFTGTRGALSLMTCNDDDSDTTQSLVAFDAVAGQTYHIEIADFGSPDGGLLLFTMLFPAQSLSNDFIRINEASDGRFVIGTTGGDPDTPDDDNKRLLFGYPSSIWSSFTTLRITDGTGTSDYMLGRDWQPIAGPSSDGNRINTTWEIRGIRVEQRLSFALNPDTGRLDTTAIEYVLTNNGASARNVGLRILLDTMIGDNDGAPFFMPGWGRLTQEQDFSRGSVPDYWVAWESPTFDPDSLKAKGFLRGASVTPPTRVTVAHWNEALCSGAGPGLFSTAWEYPVNPDTSITCDSAVALYYNPVALSPGQSRTVRTYYGLTGESGGLELAPDVASFVTANREYIQDIVQVAGDVSTVGDYFLDKLDEDKAQRVLNAGFSALELVLNDVSWARVGRGLNHMAVPGYKAALHASWRGWVHNAVQKHWYKPLYDAIQNNRQVLFDEMAWAGLKYYAGTAGIETSKDRIKDWMIRTLVPGSDTTPVHDYLGVPAIELGDSYQSELLREQDDLLARLAVQPLTSEQIAAYRADMLARQEANAQIVSRLASHRDLLWHSYQKVIEDESKWWKFWGSLLIKWGVVGGASLLWDGPGFYVASIGTTGVATIYHWARDTQAIKHDEKMYDQSLDFFEGRLSLTYIDVAHNTVGALNLVRAGDIPEIAGGDVSVEAMESFGHYRLWPKLWWAEERSQVRLAVRNTESFTTTFGTWAAYDHSGFWIGTERLLPEGESLDLTGYAERTAVIPLKSEEWGESPNKGNAIDLLVLGYTGTGIYPVASQQVNWDPVPIEQLTGMPAVAPARYTPAEVAEAPTFSYPISSVITNPPGSSDHQATIAVINPFTLTVSARVTQTIPAKFEILDPGDAQVIGDVLVWNNTLEPETGIELRALLRWEGMPGEVALVPGPDLSFTDPDTGLGDTYTAPAETVPAAWPIEVSSDIPLTWQIGTTVDIPITLTNTSTHTTAQGLFTSTVSTADGKLLWSTDQVVSIPAGATQPLSLQLQVPARMGYAVVTDEMTLGSVRRIVFREVVDIRGYQTYLPLVSRQADTP